MSETPIKAEAVQAETVEASWTLPERLAEKPGDSLSFTVPRERIDWPLEAELSARDSDPIGFAAAMIGDAEFAKVRALRPTSREFVDLADAITVALGMKSAGESSASSD